MLLNGVAVAKMSQGLFEEAESSLKEALSRVSNNTFIHFDFHSLFSTNDTYPASSLFDLRSPNRLYFLRLPTSHQSPSDPDSLANIISVSYHLNRPQDVINRYMRLDSFP